MMKTDKNRQPALLLFVMLAPLPIAAFAGEQNSSIELSWLQMGMGLFGGLALFLYGMDKLGEALKASAGEKIKNILASLTSNRIKAAMTGAFVTAVIQSSSVTTVLVVGFVSAGLMNLTQSVGIIMGANIGTTITAQIVAFKITEIALLLIAAGFAMSFGRRPDNARYAGNMIMGLGLIFFGMNIMSDAMAPLREYQPFLDLMVKMENPVLGILVAAGFTALVQSSSATTGIVIVMASQGFITLPAGIAMALGANIGTCVTALLASLGKSRQALQASFVHVLFNVAGALLWVFFIKELAEMATALSPSYPELGGSDRLAAETPRQIANANTLFNIVNTLLFLPLAGVFAVAVNKLVPLKPEKITRMIEPKYLDNALLETPAIALEHVRMELGYMGEQVLAQLDEFQEAIASREKDYLLAVAMQDDRVDILYEAINDYLDRIQKHPLSTSEADLVSALLEANLHLEMIGDVIETDLVALGLNMFEDEVVFSKTTRQMLDKLYNTVRETVEMSIMAITGTDEEAAEKTLAMEIEIQRLEEAILAHQRAKIGAEPSTILKQLQSDIKLMERMRHIYSLARRIVRSMNPETYQRAESA
jgi:phosphate:Na+ symporter